MCVDECQWAWIWGYSTYNPITWWWEHIHLQMVQLFQSNYQLQGLEGDIFRASKWSTDKLQISTNHWQMLPAFHVLKGPLTKLPQFLVPEFQGSQKHPSQSWTYRERFKDVKKGPSQKCFSIYFDFYSGVFSVPLFWRLVPSTEQPLAVAAAPPPTAHPVIRRQEVVPSSTERERSVLRRSEGDL